MCWARWRKATVRGGLGVKIITGDRDLLQLVDERIIVSLPGKSLSDSKDYMPEDVVEYLGVRPDQVVDYKALVGDKSDNIPGVAGIGEKTAVSLLKEYQTLERCLCTSGGTGSRREEEAGSRSGSMPIFLASWHGSCWIWKSRSTWNRRALQSFDLNKVEALFRELEFRTLMARLTELAKSYGKQVPTKGQQLHMFRRSSKGTG